MKRSDFIKFTKALEKLQVKNIDRQYRRFINAVQKEALALHRRGLLSRGAISAFIKKNALKASYDLSTLDSYIAAQFRLPKSPLYELSRVYKSPMILAEKVHTFNVLFSRGSDGRNLIDKEKQLFNKIRIVYDKNADFLKRLTVSTRNAMGAIEVKIADTLTGDIMDSYHKLRRGRIDGVPLTNEQIADRLHRQYSDATVRTERILRTEVHTQQQVVGQAVAVQNNYRYKIWINRPDLGKGGEVRNSHKELHNQKIRIDEYFNVGGHKAQYPGDTRLPVGERVNCRCELKFA